LARSRDDILRELEAAGSSLVGVERTCGELKARIAALQIELAALSPMANSGPALDTRAPQTPADKVKLFRSLFRGRTDVFPVRFVSKKTGRAGYAPACSNKWVPEICLLKSGGKCSDCTNQAFVPVGEQLIAEHLQGRHVMGVYPLLEDETCWFLAVDFDKRSWQEDVMAFAETCRSARIPVAIERSRSGNGAHAWFFFATAVSANVARRMGCYLITETMNRRHELSMESYDRLFPNQDTMPRGGFGNLIALPLQHEARQQGNSVFVGEGFKPFADQWAFLASVQRIQPADAELVVQEATRTGQVIGLRIADTDEEEPAPWERPPSGRIHMKPVAGPLPPEVKAVLAQRLYVEKSGLPPSLLNQLKRIAAFQNPEFYKKQGMRLSTATTPRVISCAEELPSHISLPRGCAPDAKALLSQHQAALLVDDKRHVGSPLQLAFRGELTTVQKEAARALLKYDTGIFVAPPGIGKTVLGTHLISQRACSTLVLVHRKPLLEQWKAQLAMFLDVDEKDIGQIGGGQRKPNGQLDVAMMQSLVRKEQGVDDLVGTYGHVIVDECHHVPSFSFERVLSEVKARYLVGLTATPQRRDGRQAITEMQLGPIRYRMDAKSQAARRPFEHRLIVRETKFQAPAEPTGSGIQDVYRALAEDKERNQRIIDDIIAVLQEGRSPILLTERKDHLDHLADRLGRLVRHLIVLKGGTSEKERRQTLEQLASIPDMAERLVLATGRYVGEGFDDARLDTLFLAMPVSWKGTLIQYAGRLHRHHPRKAEVRIYDYVDREIPMLLRMFEKRLTTYRAIGYARGEAPLGFGEPPPKFTVEYDEEALRHFETTI
jgi:superfamily II DNA or RNA helicase